jgi:hypothetical protein
MSFEWGGGARRSMLLCILPKAPRPLTAPQLRSYLHGPGGRRRGARGGDRRHLGCVLSPARACMSPSTRPSHRRHLHCLTPFRFRLCCAAAHAGRRRRIYGIFFRHLAQYRRARPAPVVSSTHSSDLFGAAGASALSWAAMLSTFRGSHCALVRIRGRDDATNSFIAGATPSLASPLSMPMLWFHGCCPSGAVAGLVPALPSRNPRDMAISAAITGFFAGAMFVPPHPFVASSWARACHARL